MYHLILHYIFKHFLVIWLKDVLKKISQMNLLKFIWCRMVLATFSSINKNNSYYRTPIENTKLKILKGKHFK